MAGRDWLVTGNGQIEAFDIVINFNPQEPYRLYHFLCDLEEIERRVTDDFLRLKIIRSLVRRLLMSSYWLQSKYTKPSADTGWSVLKLYDEPYFPFTVQTALWLPGQVSPIHNHGTWGVVAVIAGAEKNTFWQSSDESESKNVKAVSEHTLTSGDVISFAPDVIHSIETVGDQPTLTFNVYGQMKTEVIYFTPVKT
ncbi:hypothetical protein [Gloeocapsa sp. PCC 73106]|uniref:cysteine dioxygenase family protein n=1 Tax=Gloeocapsa sp. PCC 73106 TaxID=102232 RepID=UPI0002ACDC67|nr:hypothetical protein [Gloeocapsa sp. PCC 73106]ELR99260.1 putative metal-dependent enzyme of the double-stranded beta helix superfamily [Gloeocapsa sp. PCC 73106]